MFISEIWAIWIIMFLLWSLLVVLLERKFLAFAQRRLGPSILGRNGSLQLIWDLGKLYTKNIFTIPHLLASEMHLFLLLLYVTQLSLCMHFILGPNIYLFKNIDSLIIYMFLFTNLSHLALLKVALTAQSRYVLLSVIRGIVQIISFDIFIVLLYIIIMVSTQSTHYYNFILFQNKLPMIILFNIIGILFFIILLFEAKRTPFDHLETEAEVVAGYSTEYSGITLLCIYLIEYMHLVISAILFTIIFLGGWFFTVNIYYLLFPQLLII